MSKESFLACREAVFPILVFEDRPPSNRHANTDNTDNNNDDRLNWSQENNITVF